MDYYSIELIDINENTENFKFNKVSEKDLDHIKASFYTSPSGLIEFSSLEGSSLLQIKFFRGLMFTPYIAPPQTIMEETLENSVEISRLDLKHRPDNQIETARMNLKK